MRECGTCSLCCKLPYVAELNKSIDTWCTHCEPGKGCTIYTDRPQQCRDFRCWWLDGRLSDEWYPARCKMFVHTLSVAARRILVTVDPAFPNAWRREPYYSTLCRAARHYLIDVRIGCRFVRLATDGSEQEAHRTQAHIEGRDEA